MRLLALVVLAPLALAGCKKEPVRPLAGIYALSGEGTLTRADKPEWRREAKVGQTLQSDMSLTLHDGATAVLEGFNGVHVTLAPGTHLVSELSQLGARGNAARRVWHVGSTATKKELPPLLSMTRYEPNDSGKLVVPTEESEGMSAFFSPGGMEKGVGPAEHPSGPGVAGRATFLKALRRPVAPGDGQRVLSSASGVVVVEFADNATALTKDLKLPLDLSEVRRLVCVDGAAELKLADGAKVSLATGEQADIAGAK